MTEQTRQQETPEEEQRDRQDRDRARSRRRRMLLWSGIGLVLVLPFAAALLWFYFVPTRVGTDQALALVNRQLARATNLRMFAREVTPTWNGVKLNGVRVEAERNGQWHPLLRSPEINIDVSLLELALSRPQTLSIDAASPVLTLYYDEAGEAVLPVLRGKRQPAAEKSPPAEGEGDGFRIRLDSAQFRVSREGKILNWWQNGKLRLAARPRVDGFDIEILEGSGFLPQLGLVVRELGGRGAATSQGLSVEKLSVDTDAGSVAVSGRLEDQEISARLHAERWPWEFFAEILEQPGVDVPGTVELDAEISGTLKSPVVATELSGIWREEPFRAKLAGQWDDPAIRLSRARVEWGTAILEGTGSFQFNGRWQLTAAVSGLDLSQLERLAPSISLPVSNLSGPMRVNGNQGRLRIYHEELNGSFAGIPIENVVGEWSLDGGGGLRWLGSGSVAGGTVETSGSWVRRQLSIQGRGEDVRLADLRELHPTLSEVRSGRADFEFEGEGPVGAIALSGRTHLTGVTWHQFDAGELGVGFEGRVGAGEDSLTLDLRGSRFDAGGVPFDTVGARGRWRSGELRVASLHLARADTSLSASFTASAGENGWSVEASSLRLRAGEAVLLSDGPVALEFADGGVTFRTLALRGNAGRCQLTGWVRGRQSDLHMSTQDLDLAMALGGLVKTPIAGRMDLDAHLTSGAEELHLVLEVAVPNLRYGEAEADSLIASLVVGREGTQVDIERLDVRSSAGRLSASGDGILPADSTSQGERWWKPLGRMQAWRGTVRAENLDLSAVARFLPGEKELTGELNAAIELQGPASDRSGRAVGRIQGLGVNGYRFDDVKWEAHYGEDRLTIDSFSATAGKFPLRVRGSLPLVLAWGESSSAWFPEQSMELKFDLPEDVLRQLPLFLPLLAAAEGQVESDIRLVGTPKHPALLGTLEIRKAAIRVTGREEIYRGVRASIEFDGERIVIRDIEARQGSDGGLRGSGEYWLFGEQAGRYHLELKAENALAQASGEYAISFDGDFVVNDGPRLPGVVIAIPHVRGKVNVRTGVILYDFSDPENVVYLTGPRQAPMYIYDLEVEAPRRVYWRTPSANIELAARLNMSQSLEGLKMWGTIQSLRGTYFFLENKFTVESGELIFDQAESMNPKIEASAISRVTRALGQKQYEKEEIHIELSGRIQKPEMRLWSSSGLGQTDIVELLTVGRFGIGEEAYTGGDQRLLVGVTGTQYLVRQLAREFPEISPLLADIEVGTTVGKGSTGERIYTTVGLSRYFTPDLLLRYSQVVGGGGSTEAAVDELNLWDVSAEYRIGRLFFLTGEIIERRVTSSLGSGTAEHEVQYNLDVRARLEY